MAIEVGAAVVSLIPSAKDFSATARRLLKTEMNGIGTQLGKGFGEEFSGSASKSSGKGLADGVKKQSKPVSDEGGKAGKKYGEEFGAKAKSTLGSAVKLMGTFLGAMGLKEIVGGLVEAASTAEQSSGAVAAIFKEHTAEIEQAASDAAQAVGMSANEYRTVAATLGAQLKNLGIEDFTGQTKQLVTLGADLAAQFGGSTKDAVEALTAVLRGETDPIERYGVSINEAAINSYLLANGAEKVNGAFTEQQKTQARLALIMKQTADAQGTAAREAGTYEGQMASARASAQNLAETIGKWLLPYATQFMGYMNSTGVPALQAFAEEFQNGTGNGGKFKDILQMLAGALSTTVGFIKDNANWLVPLVVAMGTAAVVGRSIVAVAGMINTAMNLYRVATGAAAVSQEAFNAALIANPITWVVVAVAALVAALVYLYKTNDTVRNAIDGAWKAIKDGIGAVVGWLADTAVPGIVGAWNGVKDFFIGLWGGIVGAFNTAKDTISAVASSIATVFSTVFNVILTVVKVVIAVYATVYLVAFKVWWAVVSALFQAGAAALSVVWDRIQSVAGAVAGWFMTYVWPLFVNFWNNLVAGFNVLKAGVELVWQGIQAATGAVADWFMAYVWPLFVNFWNNLVAGFNGLKAAVGLAWQGIRAAAQAVSNWFSGTLVPALKAVWDAIRVVFSYAVNWIKTNAIDPLISKISKLPDVFEKVKDGIGRTWDGIKDKVREPVQWVVNTVIRDGIAAAWNQVAEKLSLPRWDFRGFARGGWTGPGTKYQPAGIVHADEFVIRKEARRAFEASHPGALDFLNRTGSLPGYANGGMVFANPVGSGLKKLLELPFNAVKGLIDSIGSRFGESDWVKLSTEFAKKPANAVQEFLDKLIDKVFPDITWNGSAGVAQWADIATKALEMTGQPLSLLGSLLRRMDQESGGNPRAINLWDSNAAAGTPSMGLMQTIGPTFEAYKYPGYNDIWDPLSNILASIRYALAQYGSLSAAYDRAGGYAEGGRVRGPFLFDRGGYLPPGLSLVANHTGRPERVLNPSQEARMLGGGDTYNLYTVDRDNVSEIVGALDHATRKSRLARHLR